MEDDHARAGHFYKHDILSFTYCHHSTNLTIFPQWPTLTIFLLSKNSTNPKKRNENVHRLLGTVSTQRMISYSRTIIFQISLVVLFSSWNCIHSFSTTAISPMHLHSTTSSSSSTKLSATALCPLLDTPSNPETTLDVAMG